MPVALGVELFEDVFDVLHVPVEEYERVGGGWLAVTVEDEGCQVGLVDHSVMVRIRPDAGTLRGRVGQSGLSFLALTMVWARR